jgi:hypothetical protein
MHSPQLNLWSRFKLYATSALVLLPFGLVYAVGIHRGWDRRVILFPLLLVGVGLALVSWRWYELSLLATPRKIPSEMIDATFVVRSVRLDAEAVPSTRRSTAGSGLWAYADVLTLPS